MRRTFVFIASMIWMWPVAHAQLNIWQLLKEDLNPPPIIQVKGRTFRPPPQWFSCRGDRDCVHIDFYCAEAVVNKRFYTRAVQHYRTRNEGNRCTRRAPSGRRESYKVFCDTSTCKRQGVSPNPPIFSEFKQEQAGENIFIRNIRKVRDEND